MECFGALSSYVKVDLDGRLRGMPCCEKSCPKLRVACGKKRDGTSIPALLPRGSRSLGALVGRMVVMLDRVMA